MNKPIVWIASYPRSGNTYLRTLLHQCMGLRSSSVYNNDLGGISGVEKVVGHVPLNHDGTVDFPDQPFGLVKTHERPTNDWPAIYILRDGRAATISLYHFWQESTPMMNLIEGRTRFGTWAGHIAAWNPAARPNTVTLRYEELVKDTIGTLRFLSDQLRVPLKSLEIPPRDELAAADGRWMRGAAAPRRQLTEEELQRFWEINGTMMSKCGYT